LFPITHIYFSNKILGRLDNMMALGAVFPDITISGVLSYDKTHKEGIGLYNHFKFFHQEYMDFANAMITHTVDPKGLDYYGDEQYLEGYKGYCFQKGKVIENETIEICNIPNEYSLWKAHNIIEMAVELIIHERNKEYGELLSNSFKDKELLQCICSASEDYYKLNKGVLYKCIEKFSSFVELNDLNSLTLARKYDMQMKAKHGISIQIEKCSRLIDKCCDIVNEDLDIFFDYAVNQVLLMTKGDERGI